MYTGLTAKLLLDDETESVAYISNFSVEETRDILEVTELGKKSKGKVAALKGWSASADGAADFTAGGGQASLRAAMVAGTRVKVTFYLDTTVQFTGYALVESLSIDISAEDKGNISISLSGIGELKLGATPDTEWAALYPA